jgi:3-deoxy-D-manno-octulosonic-acid transferase
LTESETLIRCVGALIVENAYDLAYKIRKFMSDKKFLENTGRNVLKAVKSQNGAVSFTVKKIKENLNA